MRALIFALCTTLCTSALATPVVVLRTEKGYIVATNGIRGNGRKVCKLQYNDQQVLLHEANSGELRSLTAKHYTELNDLLWKELATQPSSMNFTQMGRSLEARMREIQPIPPDKEDLIRIVLVSVIPGGPAPGVIITRMAFRQKFNCRIDFPPVPRWNYRDMKVGDALVWIETDYPVVKTGLPPTVESVRKLLEPASKQEQNAPPFSDRTDIDERF